MENNNPSKHHYFTRWIKLKKADAEIRGKFSLDALAKNVYWNKQKRKGLKFNRNFYLQSN
jgi:glutamyl-tRNA reductase